MFQELKAKRSPLQIVGIVVIFILAILIVLTFVLFGMFKGTNAAPKLFGYRVYVVNNDRMEPRIPEGAAVFVEEGTLPDPSSQSVILCRIDDQLWVIGFVGTDITESGETSYLVKYDNATDDKTWGIKQSDIIGVAKTQDKFFGGVIRFASSKAGMMTIVIIPCLLVIIYEVVMLLLSRSGGSSRRSSSKPSSSKSKKNAISDTVETVIRSVGGGPDPEDIAPEREDIQLPIDTAEEERYVEKQLRKANDKLSTTIMETAGEIEAEEIKLDHLDVDPEQNIIREASRDVSSVLIDPINVEPEPLIRAPEPKPEPKPAEEKPLTLDDLSPSRIDELIKLLEEEKKRLEDK